jgi:hypothetical protein
MTLTVFVFVPCHAFSFFFFCGCFCICAGEESMEDVVVHIESDSDSSLDEAVDPSPAPSSSRIGREEEAKYFVKKEVNVEERLGHSHERTSSPSSIPPSNPMFSLRDHLDLNGVPKSAMNMIAVLEEMSKDPMKYPVVNFLEKIHNFSSELFQNMWCKTGLTLVRTVLMHSIATSQGGDALKVLGFIEKLVPSDRSFLNASGLPSCLVQLADSDHPSIRQSAENVVNAWSRRPAATRMTSKRPTTTSDAEREKAKEFLRRQLGSIEKRERPDGGDESDDRVSQKMKSSLDDVEHKKKRVRWAAQLEHVRTFERDELLKPKRMSKRGEHLEEKFHLQKLRKEEDQKRSRVSDMLSHIPWKRPPSMNDEDTIMIKYPIQPSPHILLLFLSTPSWAIHRFADLLILFVFVAQLWTIIQRNNGRGSQMLQWRWTIDGGRSLHMPSLTEATGFKPPWKTMKHLRNMVAWTRRS